MCQRPWLWRALANIVGLIAFSSQTGYFRLSTVARFHLSEPG
jgi:hypothetical protein